MDDLNSSRQLLIIDKYDDVVAYLYPIFHSLPKSHSALRQKAIDCLLDQPRLFIEAGKSNQVSRLYAADANLALLRWYLRFLAGASIATVIIRGCPKWSAGSYRQRIGGNGGRHAQ